MSTQTITPDVNSSVAFVQENSTVGRIAYVTGTDDEGNKSWKWLVVPEDVANKVLNDEKYEVKEGVFAEAVCEGIQTFIRYKVNSIDGALELMPEEEVVNMINSGISVKQGNAQRGLVLGKDKKTGEFDFEFSENPYDLKQTLAEITNKRLTPTEKLTRDLSEGLENVPVEMLDKFMALLEARKKQALGQ